MENRIFKWTCLIAAIAAAAVMGGMINDLRIELKRSAETVNQKLPEILKSAKKSTTALAQVADDIKQLRDLAGVSGQTRDRSLVAYADSILDFLEASEQQIGLKKLIGSELKNPVPAREWVVAARKEAVWLSFRSRSKTELLDRLCKNKFGRNWMISAAEGESKSLQLIEWLKQEHADTTALFAAD